MNEEKSVFNKLLPFQSSESAGGSSLHVVHYMQGIAKARGAWPWNTGMASEHFSGLSTSCCRWTTVQQTEFYSLRFPPSLLSSAVVHSLLFFWRRWKPVLLPPSPSHVLPPSPEHVFMACLLHASLGYGTEKGESGLYLFSEGTMLLTIS